MCDIALGKPIPIDELNKLHALYNKLEIIHSQIANISSNEPDFTEALKDLANYTASLIDEAGADCKPTPTMPSEATIWLAVFTIADSFSQFHRMMCFYFLIPSPGPTNWYYEPLKFYAAKFSTFLFGSISTFGIWHFIRLLPTRGESKRFKVL
uniref:Uncharacterized protein n=1 Tax=Panagrolaimus davidi TaxID=227884 RepID=A0A914PPF8_9BILA